MSDKERVPVRFTEQQLKLLDKVREEGVFGESYEDVIVALFREYSIQALGPEVKKK